MNTKAAASLQVAGIVGVIFGFFSWREHNVLLAFVAGYIIHEAKGHAMVLIRRKT